MIAEGAFVLLKADRFWPESAKWPKIYLIELLKILRIGHSMGAIVTKATIMVAGCPISAGYG
jgi:hypothetical protein